MMVTAMPVWCVVCGGGGGVRALVGEMIIALLCNGRQRVARQASSTRVPCLNAIAQVPEKLQKVVEKLQERLGWCMPVLLPAVGWTTSVSFRQAGSFEERGMFGL